MDGIDHNYFSILENLKEKIRLARQKTVLTVNKELLQVYWEIGNTILQQQAAQGWGAKVIDKLAADLKNEFSDMKGFSVRNIKYMRAFAEAYPQFMQQSAAQIQDVEKQAVIIVQQAAAQLPWGHHQLLLDKLNTAGEREFYIKKSIENGWSRNVLAVQIESQLHLRQGNAITNFDLTLPKPHSDLAKESIKNPYIFDFLAMGEKMQERELENALIQHIKKFMLELGRGFAYVGNQYNLKVEGDDFYLDLLFFNYHLDCFVVFELKVGEFEPEFAGKLNFYINTIDAQIKLPRHKPTIGVLLCKTPNETVVQYALKGIDTPMGVAEYEFTNALPKQLRTDMPTIEELEQEIEKEIENLQKPIDEKKNRLHDIIKNIKQDQIKRVKESKDVIYLFEKVILPLRALVMEILKSEMELFASKRIDIRINDTSNTFFMLPDIEAKILKQETIWKLGLSAYFNGFKPAGTKTFGLNSELILELNDYKYQLRIDNGNILEEYLYHFEWTAALLSRVAEKWSELIIDDISKKAGQLV